MLARGTHDELLAAVPGYAALVSAYEQAEVAGVTATRDAELERREARPEAPSRPCAAGLRLMPELRRGLPAPSPLALVATAGRVVVPVAVQQVHRPRPAPAGGPDLGADHLAGRSPARWSC